MDAGSWKHYTEWRVRSTLSRISATTNNQTKPLFIPTQMRTTAGKRTTISYRYCSLSCSQYIHIYIYIRSIDVAVVQMAPFPWCWSPSLCIRRNYLCLAPCLCIAQSEHRHRAKGATELKYKTALLQQHGTHWLWRWILVNTVRSWVGYGSILDVTVSVCVVGVHHLVMR